MNLARLAAAGVLAHACGARIRSGTPSDSAERPGRDIRGAGRRLGLEDGRAARQRARGRQRHHDGRRSRTRRRPTSAICARGAGVNVTQVSARDINITTRGATSTLSTSQLALVDGRSVYLDFFGMVMWDLVPTNPDEIRQIEVIRGPASAVWGANAMSGVVNVITKSPRELAAAAADALTIGVGSFDRNVGARAASAEGRLAVLRQRLTCRGRRTIAGRTSCPPATSRRIRCRVRPDASRTSFSTPYPAFTNEGTVAAEVRRARGPRTLDRRKLVVRRRRRRHEGIIHSGIGPFNIANGSKLGVSSRPATRRADGASAFFTNLLNGNAIESARASASTAAASARLQHQDVRHRGQRRPGRRHDQRVQLGGNFRHNTFDISMAPNGDNRNEGGAYMQDEIFLGKLLPVGRRRTRGQVLVDRQRRVLAADDVDDQAERPTRRSASRSTARSARRRSSTTTSTRRS